MLTGIKENELNMLKILNSIFGVYNFTGMKEITCFLTNNNILENITFKNKYKLIRSKIFNQGKKKEKTTTETEQIDELTFKM